MQNSKQEILPIREIFPIKQSGHFTDRKISMRKNEKSDGKKNFLELL